MITDHEHADVRRVSAAVSAAVAATATAAAGGGAAKPKPKRGRPRRSEPAIAQLDNMTRITAAVILEVLAGERTTGSAATLIGVSPVRYYAIESRAVAGLIAACAPRPSGPAPGSGEAERDLRRTIAEKDSLAAQVRRLQSLLRSAQRSLGVTPVEPKPAPAARADGKKPKSHRRPRVRALTLVRRLMAQEASTNPPLPTTVGSGSAGG